MNCQYCNKEYKTQNSLKNHELRCKNNPNRIKLNLLGNKGNMPKHTNKYYTSKVKMRDGTQLDITYSELDVYKQNHLVCEICGKTIEESISSKSKYAPKRLCIDHDHLTNKFRGLLCSLCNRQLGWYEKYKNEINNYLNKNDIK